MISNSVRHTFHIVSHHVFILFNSCHLMSTHISHHITACRHTAHFILTRVDTDFTSYHLILAHVDTNFISCRHIWPYNNSYHTHTHFISGKLKSTHLWRHITSCGHIFHTISSSISSCVTTFRLRSTQNAHISPQDISSRHIVDLISSHIISARHICDLRSTQI